MTADIDGRPGADAWGIQRHWVDANDRPQTVADETILALRNLIGEPPSAHDRTVPIVTRPGRDLGLGDVVIRVVCEDGQRRSFVGAVPHDFPLGYHQMHTDDAHMRPLIVSPGRCWLPAGWRAWGWTVQVYARSVPSQLGVG